MDGYQIVEPAFLSRLVRKTNQFDFTVAVLLWLANSVKERLGDRMDGLQLDVIPVTYLGSYPALGIRYRDQNGPDAAPMIERAIDQIMNERSVLQLVEFVATCDTRWDQVAESAKRSTDSSA